MWHIRAERQFRCRIAVDVLTSEGPRSGSCIGEVWAKMMLALMSEEHSGSSGLRGQAVIVGALEGPLFFLTDQTFNASTHLDVAITRALLPAVSLSPPSRYTVAVREISHRTTPTKAEVPPEAWPIALRFENPSHPLPMRRLNPVEAGVTRVAVETTRDPISIGIEQRLPWLRAMDKFQHDGTDFGDLYPVEALDLRHHPR